MCFCGGVEGGVVEREREIRITGVIAGEQTREHVVRKRCVLVCGVGGRGGGERERDRQGSPEVSLESKRENRSGGGGLVKRLESGE